MKWKKKRGREVNVVPLKYKIKWNDDGRSKPETLVRKFLRSYWERDIVLAEFCIPSTLFRIDLINLSKKIAIEISPDSVHLEFNQFMHGSRAGYLKKLKADYEKMELMELNGFKFIELNDRHLENLTKEMFKEEFSLNL